MGENNLIPADQVLPHPLPVIPIPGPIVFPTLMAPLVVWESRAISTVEEALKSHKMVGLLLCKDDNFPDSPTPDHVYQFGVLGKILKRIKLPDGSIQVLIQGIRRFQTKSFLSTDPHWMVAAEYIEEPNPQKSIELDALSRTVIQHVKVLSESNSFFTDEMRVALVNAPHPGVVADIVAFALGLGRAEAQNFLEIIPIEDRFARLLGQLKREQDVATVQRKINDEVNNKVNSLQREFFLKEQLKLIKRELGMEEEGKEQNSRSFAERISAAGMPTSVEKIARDELKKFETLNEASPEYNISRNYLETLCDLPWNKRTEDQLGIETAREILDEDHLGLEKVKARILEFIAVRNLAKTEHRGSIILLVGPPGVGKTSIGKSIAKSMGRNFYRFSLGGMRDEAEIKGHRRTYVGAMPGKFIQAARRVGSKNAVILLDEIDKMASHYHGDPASALLEVLDPEQNSNFLDHYLDVPYDLSETIFICTANTTQSIPPALLDRMEIIELSGYTFEEKEHIARKHLLPRVLKRSGLKADQVKIDRKAIKTLIQDYAREPGLRTLEQLLEKISRKIAAHIVERREARERLKFPILIEDTRLVDYLGPKRFISETSESITLPGVVTGLAWTSMGGEILFIEATDLPGTGQLKLTGQMGEVMIESAQIAWTFVKKRLMEELLVAPSRLKDRDIHIHIPAGAIPKDGPSAGITLACALFSLFSNRLTRQKTAMTGELSLTGKVHPIGGVKEKLLAARRAGIERVIMPLANKKDFHDLPIDLLKSLDIQFVSNMDEVLVAALEPSKTRKKFTPTPKVLTRNRKVRYPRAHE